MQSGGRETTERRGGPPEGAGVADGSGGDGNEKSHATMADVAITYGTIMNTVLEIWGPNSNADGDGSGNPRRVPIGYSLIPCLPSSQSLHEGWFTNNAGAIQVCALFRVLFCR